ncbi:metallophosphoesterase, partial [Nesterenkonia muleiensis]|uniref:metallophosphoesterase n=1 Tax=Nesterenkonia muleiensis TaxID=2282648 RepID=UPI00130036B0
MTAALMTMVMALSISPAAFAEEPEGSEIVLSTTEVLEAGSIDVEYLTDQPADTNWVAVYTEDQPDPAPEAGMAWAYAPGESGTASLELNDRDDDPLPAGSYRIEYLHDDGYDRLADPVEFTIVTSEDDEDEGVEDSHVDLSASALDQGETLTVTYSTDTPDPQNWIGIYRDDMTPGPVPSLMWEYTPEGEGQVEFSTAGLEPGDYLAWFLAEDGYEPLTDAVAFTVNTGSADEDDPEDSYDFDPEALNLDPITLQSTSPETDGVIWREDFNNQLPGSHEAPQDWTITVDESTAGGAESWEGWTFSSRSHWSQDLDLMRDRFGRSDQTIVVADAEQYGGEYFSSTLHSAPVPIDRELALRLTFDSHYRGAAGQSGVVTVSFDGSEPQEILRLDENSVENDYDARHMNSMQEATVEVPEGAHEAVFSWTFTGGEDARYWGIDSVAVHQHLLPATSDPTSAWVVSDIQGHPHDLAQALPIYNELLPHADALLMAGDIVDTGAPWEWDEIYEVMDDAADILPRQVIASIGNHERYFPGGFEANRDRFLDFAERDEVWGEYVLEGPSGDLPLIVFGQDSADPPDVPMSTQQVQFVIDRLQYWTEQNKQVILMNHYPLGNTTSASWLPWYSDHHQHNDLLTETLANYPNAILLAGHVHYPAELGDWAVQRRTENGHPDGFWAISTLAMHNEWDAEGENTEDVSEVVTRDINQGLTLDSYGDRVVIRSYDFHQEGEQMREITIPNPLVPFDGERAPEPDPEPTETPEPTQEPTESPDS